MPSTLEAPRSIATAPSETIAPPAPTFDPTQFKTQPTVYDEIKAQRLALITKARSGAVRQIRRNLEIEGAMCFVGLGNACSDGRV